jgi:tetratricopeptide (TPR) repeat protein
LSDAYARLDACGAEPELVALGKRCLAAEKADRPANAFEVAETVATLRIAADERARRAELDRVRAEGERAKAEAESREQKKRRRVQLALAVAVALLVAVGGGFAWWNEKQEADRRAERIERHAERERDALERKAAEERAAAARAADKAKFDAEQARLESAAQLRDLAEQNRLARNAEAIAGLLAQCEEGLRAGRADRAGVPFQQAEKRAAEGRADHLKARLERCRAELALLRELDRIDGVRLAAADRITTGDGKAVPEWSAAFAAYGIVPGTTVTAEAARRLNSSPLRGRLLTTLDRWLVTASSDGLLAILTAADPDTYRTAVRTAARAGDVSRFQELAGQPAALTQPIEFAIVLGENLKLTPQRRLSILGAAYPTHPGDAGLLLALGNATLMVEAAGPAAGWFLAAVAVRPESATAWNDLGIAFHLSGQIDRAVEAMDRAVALDPHSAMIRANFGRVFLDRGQLDRAVQTYKAALRLDPNDAPAHFGLGRVYYEMSAWADARACFAEAVRLDPNYADAHNTLGVAVLQLGDPKGAIPHFERALAAYKNLAGTHSNLAGTHSNLATALEAVGRRGDAFVHYREAIRLEPNNPSTLYNFGRALLASGNPTEAAKCFQAVVRINPKDVEAQFSLGHAHRAAKNPAGAIAAYREVIRLNPNSGPAYNSLGVALATSGDLDGAIAAFTEAERLKVPGASGNLALAREQKAERATRPAAPVHETEHQGRGRGD